MMNDSTHCETSVNFTSQYNSLKTNKQHSPYEWMLALHERGYYSFPCCGYGHIDSYKTPINRGGFYNNTLVNPALLDQYVGKDWKDVSASIWCGTILVIDVDGKKGKQQFQQFLNYCDIDLKLDTDWSVITPNHGYHYLFRAPPNHAFIKNTNKLKDHNGKQMEVDIRTCRGYIIAPGVLGRRSKEDNRPVYYSLNPDLLDADGLPLPPNQLSDCPLSLSALIPSDKEVSDRQLELLSHLPASFSYIYEEAKNKRVVYHVETRDVEANGNYFVTLNDLQRIRMKAARIENSCDCDKYGRRIEGHSKTMKIIAFAINRLAYGDVNKARTIIDRWNKELDWEWSKEELDCMFLKVDRTNQKLTLKYS